MGKCRCCGSKVGVNEQGFCSLCGTSWERSAARRVAQEAKAPDSPAALQQFIDGKSCMHYRGTQRPPWINLVTPAAP